MSDRPDEVARIQQQVARLAERVGQLERQVRTLNNVVSSTEAAEAATAAASRAEVMAEPASIETRTPPPAPPRATRPPRAPVNEGELAMRWLGRAGVTALVLAAVLFLQRAFSEGWIGPSVRVAMGVVAGTVAIAWGQWLLRRDTRAIGLAVQGGGLALWYASVWAAGPFFALVPTSVATVGLLAVGVGGAALAMRNDSEALAVLGWIGALLAPPLLSTGVDATYVLMAYLAMVSFAASALCVMRNWQVLPAVAWFGGQLILMGWFDQFGAHHDALERAWIAVLPWPAIALLPTLKWLRSRESSAVPTLLPVLAQVLAWGTMMVVLDGPVGHGWHQFYLGGLLAALAAVIGHIASKRGVKGASLWYGIAMAEFLLVGGVRYHAGNPLLVFYLCVTAVFLAENYHASSRGSLVATQLAFLVLTLVVVFGLADLDGDFALRASEDLGFIDTRLCTLLIGYATAIALIMGRALSARQATRHVGPRPSAFVTLSALDAGWATLLGLFLLTKTALMIVEPISSTLEGAPLFAVSGAWLIYGIVALMNGIRRGHPWIERFGVLLIAVALAKGSIYDTWNMDAGLRILAFLFLGATALVGSFLYAQQLRRRTATARASTESSSS